MFSLVEYDNLVRFSGMNSISHMAIDNWIWREIDAYFCRVFSTSSGVTDQVFVHQCVSYLGIGNSVKGDQDIPHYTHAVAENEGYEEVDM